MGENLRSSKYFDKANKIELKIQKWLFSVFKSNLISKKVYKRIRPAGSQRSRLYGLPKVHKNNVKLVYEQETLQICTDVLYRGHLAPPAIHDPLFLEFVDLATECVEFSFDVITCKSMRFRWAVP